MGTSTSTKTGTRPFCTIGLTVVGNDVATVITSSPGRSARLPSLGDVSALSATRLALDPELTSTQCRRPHQRANERSNCCANRPEVSQKSSDASMRWRMSSASNTRPAQSTGVSPATNGFGSNAASW